ncbi:MAG TPA: site-2 protease family protein [Labilithrix sp.]|jgi:Zn-dependent protease
MPRSLRIGSVAGIALELHVSWLVALALAIVSLDGLVGGWIASVVTALAFFAGLVAHELAHALVARRLGIRVRSITLFVFGGLAQLDEEPSRPRDELLVAIAGPIASVVLAALAWAASRVAPAVIVPPLAWLAKVNLALAIFNCLPGFPLDGGRIARAAIWAMRGDRNDATIAAARIGRGIAWSLIALGVWGFATGAAPGGAWMALVGWFLHRASGASAADATMRRAIGDATAADAMRVDLPGVSPGLDVAAYVEGVVFPTGERTHVVRSARGAMGVVTYRAALRLPRGAWLSARVADILTPMDALPAVAPGAMLGDVLMLAGDAPAVRVVDAGGLVGLVDRERVVAELGAVNAAPPAWRARVATAAAVALALATACSRSEPPKAEARREPTALVRDEERTSETELQCATLRDVAVSDVVRIAGDRVFYAEESRGLTVVDLGRDGAPRLAGASPFVGTPLALYVEGGVAWVVFVDWTVPSRTVLRALDATTLAPLGERTLPGVARDVQLVGDVLYVLRDRDGRSAVSSFVVKRGAITPIDELALDGRPARLAASAAGLAAVTVDDTPAVTWIDLPLDRRGALESAGTARLAGGFPTWERGAGKTIDADEDHRVRIVRCASPACGPEDAATLETIDFTKGPKRGPSLEIAAHGGVPVTRFWGERLYVAEPHGARTELRVVLTDGVPRLAGRASVPGAITAIAAREDRVIAVGPSGTPASGVRVAMHDVDVRDPAHLRVVGSAAFGSDWTWSPAEDDERAISFEPNASWVALPFTASSADGRYEMGAQTVELGARGPRLGPSYPSPGWIDRVVFDGDRIVAVGRDGVHVIDAYTGERRAVEIR